MTKEENIILNRILEQILDGCKSCIIDCYEEDDEKLKKLKTRVRYEMTGETFKMTDKEFDVLLFEILDFLNCRYQFRREAYDKCTMERLIDDLFNDPVFREHIKTYEDGGKISKKFVIELSKKHKELFDNLKLVHMNKIDLINNKYSDDDISYLSVFYNSGKERIEEVFKVLGECNE